MKTLVLGAGALGTVLAAHLARRGHAVAVLAREPRASALRRDGLRVTGLAEFGVPVQVHTDPAVAAADADLVINALKTTQSPAVLAALRPRPGCLALSVQNGVVKNDELAAAFGAEQVLGATAMISGEVLPDGAVRFTANDQLLVGELRGGGSARCGEIVAAIADAGIRCNQSTAVHQAEWAKYALFVPMFCLAAITRQETHRFLAHRPSAQVIAALAREMAILAAAEGMTLTDDGRGGFSVAALAAQPFDDAVSAVCLRGAAMAETAPRHKVSALQDLERGRRTEFDAIVGHAWRRAQAHGLPLATLRTCHGLVSAIDAWA